MKTRPNKEFVMKINVIASDIRYWRWAKFFDKDFFPIRDNFRDEIINLVEIRTGKKVPKNICN